MSTFRDEHESFIILSDLPCKNCGQPVAAFDGGSAGLYYAHLDKPALGSAFCGSERNEHGNLTGPTADVDLTFEQQRVIDNYYGPEGI